MMTREQVPDSVLDRWPPHSRAARTTGLDRTVVVRMVAMFCHPVPYGAGMRTGTARRNGGRGAVVGRGRRRPPPRPSGSA
jgi:hypothetical protein